MIGWVSQSTPASYFACLLQMIPRRRPRPAGDIHFGASRIAPPSRITSPLSISLVTDLLHPLGLARQGAQADRERHAVRRNQHATLAGPPRWSVGIEI